MAVIEGVNSLAGVDVETDKKAARVVVVNRGVGYTVSAITGTIAAALAVNSSVFAMRLDPGSAVRAYIDRVRLQFTSIVAFTTPITAGRRIALFRGSGAAASGGTAITTAVKKHSTLAGSEFETAQGGDMRVSTTGALTVTGITFETDAISQMTLTHVGAAGAHMEQIWEYSDHESAPLILEPGQLIAVRNPLVMDAAGTWQLAINVQWREAAAY